MEFIAIDINNYRGGIPTGFDLVVVEKSVYLTGGDFDAITLYGFDEIGEFEEGLTEPQYGFMKLELN